MKRYFVETNADSLIAFVDDFGKAYVLSEYVFDDLDHAMTLEDAMAKDYSNLDNCETAEECYYSMGVGMPEDYIYDWEKVIEHEETKYTEF